MLSRRINVLDVFYGLQLAGFQVSITGRFWVSTEVQGWARMPSLPDDKQELEVIWATSGRDFEFFPHAAQELTTSLQTEFHDSRQEVLKFTDISADANTSGKVKTVKDLATAVRQNYRPQ